MGMHRSYHVVLFISAETILPSMAMIQAKETSFRLKSAAPFFMNWHRCLYFLLFSYTYLPLQISRAPWDLSSRSSPGPHEKDMSRWDMVGQRLLDRFLSGYARRRYDFYQEWLCHLPSPFGWFHPYMQHLNQGGIKLSFYAHCPLKEASSLLSPVDSMQEATFLKQYGILNSSSYKWREATLYISEEFLTTKANMSGWVVL